MSLTIRKCDDRRLFPRQLESINEKLEEVAALVRRCGIPEPFRVELSARDPVREGIPHDFEILIYWEGCANGAVLNGWHWIDMSKSDRDAYVSWAVEGACRDLLRGVMKARRDDMQKELAAR